MPSCLTIMSHPHAAIIPQVLKDFGIPAEINIVSAHRTPELMMDYARNAHKRGVKAIIAGAGGDVQRLCALVCVCVCVCVCGHMLSCARFVYIAGASGHGLCLVPAGMHGWAPTAFALP